MSKSDSQFVEVGYWLKKRVYKDEDGLFSLQSCKCCPKKYYLDERLAKHVIFHADRGDNLAEDEIRTQIKNQMLTI